MSPPAPMPEHDFERLLADHGCKLVKGAKEYKIYRKSDNKLVCTAAVRHGTKREVLPVYVKNFRKALEKIKLDEIGAQQAAEEERNKENWSNDWRDSDWNRAQQEVGTKEETDEEEMQ